MPVREEIVRSGQARGQERTRHRWESSSSDSEVLEKKKNPNRNSTMSTRASGASGVVGPVPVWRRGKDLIPRAPRTWPVGKVVEVA